jgi:hypothetical protein
MRYQDSVRRTPDVDLNHVGTLQDRQLNCIH